MKDRINRFVLSVALAATAVLAMPDTHAALVTNTGTGDIAGVPGDLTPSNTFNLNTSTLALIKRAFLANGTVLADGASVPKGTLVKFLIYINNNTSIGVSDVSVRDVLASAFAYQTGTITVSNAAPACAVAVCTPLEETAIYNAANTGTAVTDGTPDDVASYTGGTTTIDLGNQNVGTNSQLDILASKTWAVIFTVKVQ